MRLSEIFFTTTVLRAVIKHSCQAEVLRFFYIPVKSGAGRFPVVTLWQIFPLTEMRTEMKLFLSLDFIEGDAGILKIKETGWQYRDCFLSRSNFNFCLYFFWLEPIF